MEDGKASGLKDFKDLKLIGKGSFGRVFRAVRPSDNQEYAIKEVNIKAMSQREREDAVNEVRAPHICQQHCMNRSQGGILARPGPSWPFSMHPLWEARSANSLLHASPEKVGKMRRRWRDQPSTTRA